MPEIVSVSDLRTFSGNLYFFIPSESPLSNIKHMILVNFSGRLFPISPISLISSLLRLDVQYTSSENTDRITSKSAGHHMITYLSILTIPPKASSATDRIF